MSQAIDKQTASLKGALSGAKPSRIEGKKAFDWEFLLPGQDPVKVAVTLKTDDKGQLIFVATSTALTDPIRNSDIQALYAAVENMLQMQSEQLSDVDWEDWLAIKVSGEDGEAVQNTLTESWSSELKIDVKLLKRGVNRRTGRVIALAYNGVATEFPRSSDIRKNVLFQGEHFRNGIGTSYVKDSPEVRAALKDVHSKLRELRLRLGLALSQEAIELGGGTLPALGLTLSEK